MIKELGIVRENQVAREQYSFILNAQPTIFLWKKHIAGPSGVINLPTPLVKAFGNAVETNEKVTFTAKGIAPEQVEILDNATNAYATAWLEEQIFNLESKAVHNPTAIRHAVERAAGETLSSKSPNMPPTTNQPQAITESHALFTKIVKILEENQDIEFSDTSGEFDIIRNTIERDRMYLHRRLDNRKLALLVPIIASFLELMVIAQVKPENMSVFIQYISPINILAESSLINATHQTSNAVKALDQYSSSVINLTTRPYTSLEFIERFQFAQAALKKARSFGKALEV